MVLWLSIKPEVLKGSLVLVYVCHQYEPDQRYKLSTRLVRLLLYGICIGPAANFSYAENNFRSWCSFCSYCKPLIQSNTHNQLLVEYSGEPLIRLLYSPPVIRFHLAPSQMTAHCSVSLFAWFGLVQSRSTKRQTRSTYIKTDFRTRACSVGSLIYWFPWDNNNNRADKQWALFRALSSLSFSFSRE